MLDVAKRQLTRSKNDTWWRVGYHEAPADWVPWHRCSWEHRFDDPDREYRTFYCGAEKETCVRESLADLRPNVNARAELARLQVEVLEYAPDELFVPASAVTSAWRAANVLVEVRLERDEHPVADLDSVRLREQLERAHAPTLRAYGLEHLDISEVRSRVRPVTQLISRDLYERGVAALLFRSNLDDGQCLAVFEGHGWLEEVGEAIPLADDVPELVKVCGEYGLILEPCD